MLCEYYLARLKSHQMLIVIFILLIENICNNKVKDVNFHSISFQEIIMNKKKNRHKIILELTNCLFDFIRSFKQILFFFIFVVFEQTRQRRSYLKIIIYKTFIKVNEFQKYLYFAIDFKLKLFLNSLNLFCVHSYFFCEYYKV